jgi:23S rRNA (adenine2503-C2)-methyltransferase
MSRRLGHFFVDVFFVKVIQTDFLSIMEKRDLKSLGVAELQAALRDLDEPPYRAEQIRHALYTSDTPDFTGMTTLSKTLREKLSNAFFISELQPAVDTNSLEAENAQTLKFLFELRDGLHIETVLIPDFRNGRDRLTVCVSSQVGCAMACTFCATGYMGFTRNLTIGEIVDQVSGASKWAMEHFGKRVTNVVFMGMGEPMMNLERSMEAIEILSHDRYKFKIGERHITLSTVGVASGIRKLAESSAKFKLAVSLHSAVQEKRAAMMPIAIQYPLTELCDALIYYAETKGKPVFFEYLLLDGINDGAADAKALIKFARRMPCKINLIDYNPIANIDFRRTDAERKEEFIRALVEADLTVTIRRSRGKDINAACGQLATKSLSTKSLSAKKLKSPAIS